VFPLSRYKWLGYSTLLVDFILLLYCVVIIIIYTQQIRKFSLIWVLDSFTLFIYIFVGNTAHLFIIFASVESHENDDEQNEPSYPEDEDEQGNPLDDPEINENENENEDEDYNRRKEQFFGLYKS